MKIAGIVLLVLIALLLIHISVQIKRGKTLVFVFGGNCTLSTGQYIQQEPVKQEVKQLEAYKVIESSEGLDKFKRMTGL